MASVAHLTSVHRASDVRIFHKECRTLAADGHDVVLVGQHPRDENIDGVRIRRVPTPDGRYDRLRKVVPAVRRAALEARADLYHIHDPELIPLAWELRCRGGVVVYDAHEDFSSQVHTKSWLPRPIRPLVAWSARPLESIVSSTFQGVVAATPAIARRFGSAASVVVRNYPLKDEFTVSPSDRYKDGEDIIVYIGGISRARGIVHLLKALELLPGDSTVQLQLAGRFDSRHLRDELRGLPGWDRVRFLGWLSRREIGELLGEAKAGLVTLLPTPNHVESLPVKLFEYMAAGVPVVASDFPLWREIVQDASCGLLVDPASPNEIADAIQQIIANSERAQKWGMNGRRSFEKVYNWHREGRRLLDYYSRILGG